MEKGKMNSSDEQILQKNIIFIKENIIPEDILDHLVQCSVINFDQHAEIKNQSSTSNKIDQLIYILRHAGSDSLEKFIDCLRKSGYNFAADKLCIERSYSPGNDTVLARQDKSEIQNHTAGCSAENAKTRNLQERYENKLTDLGILNTENHNVSDGPVNPVKDVCTSTTTGIQTEQSTDERASGYDVIPEESAGLYDLYDDPQFPDTAGLILKIPFDNDSLKDSTQFSKQTELSSLPGWCPNINDSNHVQIVKSLKDGGYFIWFSQQKNTYIITLRTDQHKDGCIYVKVKTRTSGQETLYRLSREFEDKSLTKLFQHHIDKGLPLKFIKK